MTGWPHEGPGATLEVLRSIHGLGVDPTTTPGNNEPWSTQKRQCAGSTNSCVKPCGSQRSATRSPQCGQRRLDLVTWRLVMIERAVKLRKPRLLRGCTARSTTLYRREEARTETELAPSRRDWPQLQGGRQREQEAGQRQGGQ